MTTTATTERLVPAGTWAIDDAHSSANFEVEHGGVSVFRGGFKPIDAKLVSGDDGARRSRARVAVESDQRSTTRTSARTCSRRTSSTPSATPRSRFRSTAIDGTADDLTRHAASSRWPASRSRSRRTGRLRGPVDARPRASRSSRSRSRPRSTAPRSAWIWQMELPDGDQALANDVRLVVELELAPRS